MLCYIMLPLTFEGPFTSFIDRGEEKLEVASTEFLSLRNYKAGPLSDGLVQLSSPRGAFLSIFLPCFHNPRVL